MNDIQEKIMQANGINQSEVPQQQLTGIHKLIRREKFWYSTTKIITGFFMCASLIILGCYMLAVKFLLHFELGESTPSSMDELISMIIVLETILPLTIIIAAVSSVFLTIRAKSVNLLQVHERLHSLEEMVKVLLSK